MKFLKKRSVALVIAVIVMAATLLIGVHKSATSAINKIEDLFYKGTNSVGSDNTVAIYDQLEKRAQASLGIVTIASNYDTLTQYAQEVKNNRNALLECDSISKMFILNQELEKSTQKFISMCQQTQLSQRDSEGIETYSQQFNGAQTLIEQNSYNEKVSEFNETVLNKFPLSMLKLIVGVDAPEKFS